MDGWTRGGGQGQQMAAAVVDDSSVRTDRFTDRMESPSWCALYVTQADCVSGFASQCRTVPSTIIYTGKARRRRRTAGTKQSIAARADLSSLTETAWPLALQPASRVAVDQLTLLFTLPFRLLTAAPTVF